MNVDGSELCCDDVNKEQRNASPIECVGGGGGEGGQDVVMEMSANFQEWGSGGGGDGGSGGGPMRRRVSFPNDKNLVTGYMEPADPWANGEWTDLTDCFWRGSSDDVNARELIAKKVDAC